mmetsp:Transcript_70685/g.165570  ORF Transcript_70685/g.165570 Transcript_70685/m.165570 type:complete len:114 (+) Transcript_70685:326-667(+)
MNPERGCDCFQRHTYLHLQEVDSETALIHSKDVPAVDSNLIINAQAKSHPWCAMRNQSSVGGVVFLLPAGHHVPPQTGAEPPQMCASRQHYAEMTFAGPAQFVCSRLHNSSEE